MVLQECGVDWLGPKEVLIQRVRQLLLQQQVTGAVGATTAEASEQRGSTKAVSKNRSASEAANVNSGLQVEQQSWPSSTSSPDSASTSYVASIPNDDNSSSSLSPAAHDTSRLSSHHPLQGKVMEAARKRQALLEQLVDPSQIAEWLVAAKTQGVMVVDVRSGGWY